MVSAESVGGMGDVAVVATVGGSAAAEAELLAAVTDFAKVVTDGVGVVARVPENDDDGVDGRLVELPRRGSSRTGVTWKREKRPAAVVVAGGAAPESGGAMETACGRAAAGSSMVQGAEVTMDTGAAVAMVVPPPTAVLPADTSVTGAGMLQLVSVGIWPVECAVTSTGVAETAAVTDSSCACGMTAPTE